MNARYYLVEFVDGDHAYAPGVDAWDAAGAASERWGVRVQRVRLFVGWMANVWLVIA